MKLDDITSKIKRTNLMCIGDSQITNYNTIHSMMPKITTVSCRLVPASGVVGANARHRLVLCWGRPER
jgi:hypothetical protein